MINGERSVWEREGNLGVLFHFAVIHRCCGTAWKDVFATDPEMMKEGKRRDCVFFTIAKELCSVFLKRC